MDRLYRGSSLMWRDSVDLHFFSLRIRLPYHHTYSVEVVDYSQSNPLEISGMLMGWSEVDDWKWEATPGYDSRSFGLDLKNEPTIFKIKSSLYDNTRYIYMNH